MEYSNFLKVILGEKKASEDVHKAYKLGIDLTEFVDIYHSIIKTLFNEVYSDDGYEWYSWFCYESEYGQKDWSTKDTFKKGEDGNIELVNKKGEVTFGAHDEEGNPICYSFETLWEYLEANHKIKTKND